MRRDWAEKFSSVDAHQCRIAENPPTYLPDPDQETHSLLGIVWALGKPRTAGIRLSEKVRIYLTANFEMGKKNRKKGWHRPSCTKHAQRTQSKKWSAVWKRGVAHEDPDNGILFFFGVTTEILQTRRFINRREFSAAQRWKWRSRSPYQGIRPLQFD